MAFCRTQKWDVPIPKCVRAKKDSPPTNGLVLPSHSGAVLNSYCKQGYELHGPGAVFCDGFNGDNHKPSCMLDPRHGLAQRQLQDPYRVLDGDGPQSHQGQRIQWALHVYRVVFEKDKRHRQAYFSRFRNDGEERVPGILISHVRTIDRYSKSLYEEAQRPLAAQSH